MKFDKKFKISIPVVLISAFIIIFSVNNVFAQSGKNISFLHIKSGVVVPANNAHVWADSSNANSAKGEIKSVIIHFDKMPNEEQKRSLESYSIVLKDYVPENSFVSLIGLPVDKEILTNNSILSIYTIIPQWKIESQLLQSSTKENNNATLFISFYSDVTDVEIKNYVTTLGGETISSPFEKYKIYKVKIQSSNIPALASWNGVRYITKATDMVPCDLQSRPAVKGNVPITSPEFGGYNLFGDGVTVGVGDNSSGIFHADLKDRITNFNPSRAAHHGEHVNGIVGSAANVDPLASGMAPHVSLVDHFFDLIIPEAGNMYTDYQMNITNNSYAVILGDCNYAGTYDSYSYLIDSLAFQYPKVLHVFASGNDGWMNCSPVVPGFATVAGGYQAAKNNVVVGSFTDYLGEASDESRGPIKDGRLKPEIIATGLGAYSTIGVDDYEWAAGTSMASPQVAGGLAIITERFKLANGNALPPSDLLKALLLNGATDLGNPGPDFSYGFGGMDVYRSLLMIDSGNYFRSAVATGDSQVFLLNIPPNTAQVKVMICWNDPPASPLSSKQLVNDIDLSVLDASGNTHLPLVPDPTPANVNNPATEKQDHINNTEQVTITNPNAGTYTIQIKGYHIPVGGTQTYSLVYDIIPSGVLLTYPIGGEQINDVQSIYDSVRVFWDGVPDGNTFAAQYTIDSGNTWITISDNIPADARHCNFRPSGINSGNCFLKVSRNNTSQVQQSGRFSITTQPVTTIDTAQCPGYINIHWTSIPNAAKYFLYSKIGKYLQVVDSTVDTFYSFKNMSLTEKSYVAVAPIVNGILGYRSVSAIVVANKGNCNNSVSAGDLMIEKILSPSSGRMYTSTQLNTNDTLKLKLRNLYSASCSYYQISYQINGGTWQSNIFTTIIPADSFTIVALSGLNLSSPGNYSIRASIKNLQLIDPNQGNDSLSVTIVSLNNDTINLSQPFTDSFETMSVIGVSRDSIGVSPNGHWDYFNANDTGRMRTFVSSDVIISGSRSISLDESQTVTNGSFNRFTGTFNLKNYDTSINEIRMDFDYMLHGTPKTNGGNFVQIRGYDTSNWLPFCNYDLTTYPGFVKNVRSVSLTDFLKHGNQNFSTATQIAFCQNDTSLIAAYNYGNGLTIDNFRLYTVSNDAQMLSIVSPQPVNCGLPGTTPLTIQVHNGVNYTLYNIQVFYSLDSGGVYSGMIDSVRAKDTVNYTFTQLMNIGSTQSHSIKVWLTEAGDTYTQNDSILNYKFRNNKIINSYPYLENFESGSGGYFSDGYRDCWQWGTPASPKINKAASGTKAWKTNLSGNYNTLEKSYLYSPCFDLSSLNSPMLSFSAALDIENCGNTLCDQAYVEYSFDGATWTKLGDYGQGTNWYDSTFSIWNTEGFMRWHVASIPLDKPAAGDYLRLRFALVSDPGTNFEGFAVDDIHIFDRVSSILSYNTPIVLAQPVSGNQWYDFSYASLISASLNPGSQDLGNTTVTLYPQTVLNNIDNTQYTVPRSYNFQSANAISNPVTVRLYLMESDFVATLNDTTCHSCSKPDDAYRLGISQYQNAANPALQNGLLADDTGGVFAYYPYKTITWVPFDQGYYAEFVTAGLGEFWFNDGGPTANFSINKDYLNFTAYKLGQNVLLDWASYIDTSVNNYHVEKSVDKYIFNVIKDTLSGHANPFGLYEINDASAFSTDSILYYRLEWQMTGNSKSYFSPVRVVKNSDSTGSFFVFQAQQVNHKDVLLNWQCSIDAGVSQYIVQRKIENGSFVNIGTVTSLQNPLQNYSFTDDQIASQTLAIGTVIHYQIVAIMGSGSTIVFPEKAIVWENNNSFVSVFPNPNYDGSLTIVYYADTGTNVVIEINSTDGRAMYRTTTSATQWKNSFTFSTFHRPKGMYLMRIKIGDRQYVEKLVWE